MCTEFNINYKKFQGEFFNIIKDSIIAKYSELYPGQNINVEYGKKVNEYYFIVYIDTKVISENNEIILSNIMLTCYNNINAIKLFSNISMEKYLEEYDDSKKNYLKDFKDQTEAIILSHKMSGIEEIEFNINTNGYSIWIPNKRSWSHGNNIIGYFAFDNMITYDELRNNIAKIKSEFKKIFKN